MKKNIFFLSIILIITSCTLYVPTPDFTITWIDPLGSVIDATTTEVLISTIDVENNTSYETILDRISYDYIYNGDVIYDGQDLWNIYALLPASVVDTVEDVTVKGKATIENIPIPVPSSIYTYMDSRNIEGVTLRIYISGTDNINKTKRTTKYVDYGIARY
ncbi:MAG: hypothetical protein QME48_05205 [bacterium]|uniref:Lipoprotein n=2 Tax=Bacteria candidate phyla TaxID=1783234 RepID=A0A101I3K6_UNCT6|nr:MAG: hypothetical protein XD76_0673 [candidate division TA06 bacterium 32_111]KUK87859.1 MAG: hypothetical protein XE03_0378 [candidate division TA06 bacterium 34_109]MDI6700612.1 hypothetical protein [bacterium]HAF08011.1 hypothetical protein [candidate division WOR-3 bacterium]HCP16287.1 hypothetical protein [candidate division WOR-3 bacterium]